jgi:hypothetical protein
MATTDFKTKGQIEAEISEAIVKFEYTICQGNDKTFRRGMICMDLQGNVK